MTQSSPIFRQWIGNNSVDSLESATIEVENPSDGSILGVVPAGCEADALLALEAAKNAQPAWAKKPVVQRAKVLKAFASIIRENRKELIHSLASEQAKVEGLATVEIDVTADYFDFYAGLAYSYEGEILQSDNPGENIYVHYAPIGVAVGICPWNFPFFVMARKIAPALLSGCTVVVKSSELTPLTCFRFMAHVEKAVQAGKVQLPEGVVSLLTGYGSTVGEALCKSSIPGIISMTGSIATGKKIMINAAENMTKVSLELGGKAPAIVMADADLDKAVDAIVASRVIFSGQVCNCAERVYIQAPVYDEFLQKLVTKMTESKVGNPFDSPSPAYCSLISSVHRQKVHSMVERAKKEGATVLCGGHPIDGPG